MPLVSPTPPPRPRRRGKWGRRRWADRESAAAAAAAVQGGANSGDTDWRKIYADHKIGAMFANAFF